MGKREVSSLAWHLLRDVLENNRKESEALCPARLSSDIPKGAPPWKSFLGASASVNTFGSQTAILSHVPFYVKQQHIPFRFLLGSLTSQPPSERTTFWFLCGKNIQMSFVKVFWTAAVKPCTSIESPWLPVPCAPSQWLTRASIHLPGLCKWGCLFIQDVLPDCLHGQTPRWPAAISVS